MIEFNMSAAKTGFSSDRLTPIILVNLPASAVLIPDARAIKSSFVLKRKPNTPFFAIGLVILNTILPNFIGW